MSADLDLAELSASFRAVLDDAVAKGEVRRVIDGGHLRSEGLWARAVELGWLALTAPETHGGLGLGADAVSALYREIGRAAAPLPMLGNLLTLEALVVAGSAAQIDEWMPRLISGETLASVGAAGVAPAWSDVRVVRRADGITLNGVAHELLDGASASLFLIAARDDADAPCWVMTAAADGAQMRAEQLLDRTRSCARLELRELSLPASRLLVGDAMALAERLLTQASLALASESVGGAEAIFEITLAYLKTREQFGKPIGSFQALKHRCAEHKVAIEAAAALVEDAVRRCAAGASDAVLYAALAKAQACEMFAAVAEDAVQLHGGIGFTWEHVCHLYLKRAKLNQALFGVTAAHRDRAAQFLAA